MQIHELNTFPGRPGETDFIPVDSGFDTSKISADNLLKYHVKKPLDGGGNPYDGDPGQLLRTKGDGSTEWTDVGNPTDAQTAQAVNDWLDAHPEATTTVQDQSLTNKKLVIDTLGFVTPEMFGAIGDGITDDTNALLSALQYDAVLLQNNYKITQTITCDSSLVFGKGLIISDDGAFICNNNIRIEDISIKGGSGATAITIKGGGVVDNVKIDGGLVGVAVDNTDKSIPTEIRNCSIIHMYGQGAGGIDSLACENLLVDNCFISGITNNVNIDADGVRIWHSTGSPNAIAKIENCVITSCRGRFIKGITSNLIVEKCSLINADDYPVITYMHGIDVQRGNAVIKNNSVIAKNPINVSLRYSNQKIIIDGNYLKCTHSGKEAIDFTYTSGHEYDLDCLIANNEFITISDRYPLLLAGTSGNVRYIIDNNSYNAVAQLIALSNWNDAVRVEVTRLKKPNTAPFYLCSASQTTGAFNFYSDDESGSFYNSSGFAFADMKLNTKMLTKITDIGDISGTYLVECKKIGLSDKIFIISNGFYYRVYNKTGTLMIGN